MTRVLRASKRIQQEIQASPTTRTKSRPSSLPKTTSSTPNTPPTVLFQTTSAWETFMSTQEPKTSTGAWLKLTKKPKPASKSPAAPGLTYEQALDSALCHGWIDGQRKAFDDAYFIQRFTPRRKSSLWSKRNVDKVIALKAAGQMRESGLAEVEAAKKDGRWERAYKGSASIEVPKDFEAALQEGGVKGVFEKLGSTQRYKFLLPIETVKTELTRRRKVEQLVGILQDEDSLEQFLRK